VRVTGGKCWKREPYGKAVVPQIGPAPWRCVHKDALQALVDMSSAQ